ncbi:hypothetical protein [Engelhardtia mirabilis]|uniref:Cohesin domain protein n=1 Tax=Engelhardtia mirabilis TaxID=2528011 RepID=A0A518BQW7_9BACT|nr:hypothetical protein Pla133_44900 [Planctomycetes bacterium Pla133]QDV03697.1 hypothetical protein Pla86_44880 [Planctomycetes bacterium Pla86]
MFLAPLAASLLTLPGGSPTVDLSLSPATQCATIGSVVDIELVLSAASPAAVAAVDVVLSWDPVELLLLQATPSPQGWLATGFLNDPDGINDDLTDGDAIYTALASPFSPPTLPPDLSVATFSFQVLGSGQVAMLANLGSSGETQVVGTVPGQDLTGAIGPAAQVTATAPVAALETKRFGTPPGPDALQPGVTSGPVLGQVWDPVILHGSFLPSATLDFLVVSLAPLDLPIGALGTLLCAPPAIIDPFVTAPGQPFFIPIPNQCVLVGASLCTQGVSADLGGTVLLTNALDITLGTF